MAIDFMAAVGSGDATQIKAKIHREVFDPPAQRDPFDTAPAEALFARFHGEIDRLDEETADLTVSTDREYAEAQETLGISKKLLGRIDKKRTDLKRPYLDFTRFLDGQAKGLTDRLRRINIHLEQKVLLPYASEKRKEAQEAARKAEAEAKKRQAELDKQAAAEDKPAPRAVAFVPREVKVETDSATSKIETEWAWQIEDFAKIPAEVWEQRKEQAAKALAPAINARIKAGIRSIPGVDIYEREVLKTRARR